MIVKDVEKRNRQANAIDCILEEWKSVHDVDFVLVVMNESSDVTLTKHSFTKRPDRLAQLEIALAEVLARIHKAQEKVPS